MPKTVYCGHLRPAENEAFNLLFHIFNATSSTRISGSGWAQIVITAVSRGNKRHCTRRSKSTSRREKVSESNTYSHLSLFSSLLLSVSNRLFCPHLSALARSLSSYLCDSATLRSFLLLLIHSRGSQMTTWSDAARCLLNFAAVLKR